MAFGELVIGTSGLYAAQRGMTVTSNNITNAATDGYSRQVMGQRASNAISGNGKGMLGTGVETLSIKRVRDSYLDEKMWVQSPKLGEYSVKTEKSLLMESVFGEPSDVGFTKVYTDLFNDIDNLSKAPTEIDRKESLKTTLTSFTNYFNSAVKSLEKQQSDLNIEVKNKVDEINMLTTRIQSLNKKIYETEMFNEDANNLRDDRDSLVDKLSKIVNIESKEVQVQSKDGTTRDKFVIKLNGQNLVDDFEARTLKVELRDDKINSEDIDNLYNIKWTDGLEFDEKDKNLSGELKGLLDMRDGRGSTGGNEYKGIPYYISKMDKMVRGFANSLNSLYGKQDDGSFDSSVQLFKVELNADGTQNYDSITAKNFSISDLIKDSSSNIKVNYSGLSNNSNNDLLTDLLAQKDNGNMFGDCGAKEYMISMFSELGVNCSEAQMYLKSQENITQNIQNQRLAVSQVSTDEEFMNLIKYNQAYQAAARVISTMDEIYDLTISKLGNW